MKLTLTLAICALLSVSAYANDEHAAPAAAPAAHEAAAPAAHEAAPAKTKKMAKKMKGHKKGAAAKGAHEAEGSAHE